MSMFKKLKDDAVEKAQDDRVGGRVLLDSDIYKATIKELWAGYWDSGSMFLSATFSVAGQEISITETVTNKAGEHFFVDKDDKKKKPLPGFTKMNDLCYIATGQPLSEQEPEKKVVQVWDKEANGRINKTVDMIVEAVGVEIALVVHRQKQNKQKKDDRTGKYEDIADWFETNEIQTFLAIDPNDESNLVSMREIERAQAKADAAGEEFEKFPEGSFADQWLKVNKGKTRDRRSIKDDEKGGARSGRPGGSNRSAPTEDDSEEAPARSGKSSIFGKKK